MAHNDTEFLVQKIRTQYTEKEHTQLDALKALDAKVKRPANAFAYTFGSLAAIIMGSGMSLIMTDLANQLGLGDMTVPGIAIGAVGLVMAIINFPIYKFILGARRKKYAKQIIELSDSMTSK